MCSWLSPKLIEEISKLIEAETDDIFDKAGRQPKHGPLKVMR